MQDSAEHTFETIFYTFSTFSNQQAFRQDIDIPLGFDFPIHQLEWFVEPENPRFRHIIFYNRFFLKVVDERADSKKHAE